MKNAHASEAPFFSRGAQSLPTTDAPGRFQTRAVRHNLVFDLVAVSVVAVTIGGVQSAPEPHPAPIVADASKLAEGVAATEAYQQNGSVYTEQVPAAATAYLPAYAPGGSVYTEQVPSVG